MKRVLLSLLLIAALVGVMALPTFAAPSTPEFDFAVYPMLRTTSSDTEMSCIIQEGSTYYLFYHYATGVPSFSIGVATSTSPYGPWTKGASNPILSDAALGMACPKLIKVGSTWYMVLIKGGGDVYLATPNVSGNLTDTWTLGSKIIDSFGYTGAILYTGSQYRIYACYPLDVNDEGPIAMATASAITGPWTKYSGNPVINYGAVGSWYRYGFPECGIIYQDGYYQSIISGAPAIIPSRNNGLGFAYSADGISWTLSASQQLSAADMAFRYLSEPWTDYRNLPRAPIYACYTTNSVTAGLAENIGLNVFSLSTAEYGMSVGSNVGDLTASETMTVGYCYTIREGAASVKSFTISCTYHASATAGVKLHYYASTDGSSYTDLNYDSTLPFTAGTTVQTIIDPRAFVWQVGGVDAPFIKIVPENLDGSQSVTDITIVARLVK